MISTKRSKLGSGIEGYRINGTGTWDLAGISQKPTSSLAMCELVVTTNLCATPSEGSTEKLDPIWCTYLYLGIAYRVNLISSWIASLTASSTSFASKVGVLGLGNDDRCRGL